jgi:hypothetical protein
MFKVIVPRYRRLALPLAIAFALGLNTACTSTSTAPQSPRLSGQWQLDRTASDDADAKISEAIEQAESKLRKRLAEAGFSQYDQNSGNGGGHRARHGGSGNSDSTELNGEEFSQTGFIGPDFAALRRNLHQALGSPQSLTIDVKPDAVRLAADNGPPRDYPSGDEFTRIDEYGTAHIDTSWSGPTFNLRARYSSKATMSESYTADDRTDTLTVMRHLTDPVVGKLSVRSVYRR